MAGRIKRYSVVGNDPSFKQYTKDHEFYDVDNKKVEKENLVTNVLSVSLKDLYDAKQSKNKVDSELLDGHQREQYRIIKKDLLFIVNFTSINSSRYLGSQEAVSERTHADFRKLGQAL